MSVLALEISDESLLAVRDGTVVADVPSVAIVGPGALRLGESARAALCLEPALVSDDHWEHLSLEPLPHPVPQARCSADLVYAQLQAVWQALGEGCDALLLAVPATLRERELGLLLGIARALSLPVAGLVDAAVAACAGLPSSPLVLHVDVQRHQSVVTEVLGCERWRRGRVELAPRVALHALRGAWAHLVAEALVRRARFDPLRHAASEQALHDSLPTWLARSVAATDVEVELPHAGGTATATLRREQFAFAAEAWYSQLAALVQGMCPVGRQATVALSARAAGLPGLAARLGQLERVNVVPLPPGAAARGALAHEHELRAAGPEALTVGIAAEAARPAPARTAPAPTHVVFGGHAHAITAEPLVLGSAPAGRRTLELPAATGIAPVHCSLLGVDGIVAVHQEGDAGIFLNGMRVDGTAQVAAGDQLRLGADGVVLEFVVVR